MLKVCQKFNTNLCIENLYSDQEIPYIFQNIKHKNLKICFDYGHHNFLTPKFDIMKNFGEYVTVLHIHNNNGQTDEHLPMCFNIQLIYKIFCTFNYSF